MLDSFKKLKRKQVQEQCNEFLELSSKPLPEQGWIHTIRHALGLSTLALSKKLGFTRQNIVRIEKSEKQGTINLNTLQKVGEALDCKLVYCLVPNKPLDKILEDRAKYIAKKQIHLIRHSMGMDEQELTPEQLKQQEDALVEELLQGNPKKLWKPKTITYTFKIE